MSWEGSDRRERLPPDWPAQVARIKKRDKMRCRQILPSGQRCPRRGTDVDHIIPGDDHRDSNLQLLCSHHHLKKTAKDAYVAKKKIRMKGRRLPEQHPGDV